MDLSRRDFLKAITVCATALTACSSEDGGATPPADGARFFPQSVASGDPRPGTVVLWTRLSDEASEGTARVRLEVATDRAFTVLVVQQDDLLATAAHDGVVKVKVTGLAARTTYFYRFIYQRGDRDYASRTGRTRTAPLPSDDAGVRFAVASCQDFVGRYYNSWQRLVELDAELDFVLFLGDYVYETTANPGFMSQGGSRAVTFADADGALALGSEQAPYYAAHSISNYRDLYKTVRSDAFLQAAHERYPFVFMWDDHEYADDAHGSTSTYTDGRQPEQNDDRKRNAERAYFEYVPLDHPGDSSELDALPVYPDTRIYRTLGFGTNMRLLVADCRTYRADHLIPEDGYPAEVVVTADDLASAELSATFSDDAFAYVDIDDPAYALSRAYLRAAYVQLAELAGVDGEGARARAERVVRGNLALAYVNRVLTSASLNLPAIEPTAKPRGIAWVHMGKRDLFASQGARYVVIKDAYDVYASLADRRSLGASQSTFGATQSAWLDAELAAPESWKVLVSSFSLTSMVIDLRDKLDVEDPALRNRYYLNVDQWDGFPQGRARLLAELVGAPGAGGALVVSGDIHASFASVESGVPCVTAPAISSGSIRAGAKAVVNGAGFGDDTALFRYVVTEIDSSFAEANSGIAFSDTDSHGFVIVEINGGAERDRARVTFHLVPSAEVQRDYTGRGEELAGKFVTRVFDVRRGAVVAA